MSQLIKKESFSLTPRTLDEAMQFAKLISDSDICPKDFKGKPGNVLVAVQMGAEVGLPAMQALQNIAVINGRPSIWGDAAIALVMAHPEFEGIHEELKGEGDNRIGYCIIRRKGMEPQIKKFSVDDAKKAGLWGKVGPWTQYPERMLQLRARGFALRDVFSDALKGLITREEAEDMPSDDSQIIKLSNADILNKKLGLIEDKPEALPSPATVNQETGEYIKLPDFNTVKFQIESALNIQDLTLAGDQARLFPEGSEQWNQLKDIYKQRKRELNTPAKVQE